MPYDLIRSGWIVSGSREDHRPQNPQLLRKMNLFTLDINLFKIFSGFLQSGASVFNGFVCVHNRNQGFDESQIQMMDIRLLNYEQLRAIGLHGFDPRQLFLLDLSHFSKDEIEKLLFSMEHNKIENLNPESVAENIQKFPSQLLIYLSDVQIERIDYSTLGNLKNCFFRESLIKMKNYVPEKLSFSEKIGVSSEVNFNPAFLKSFKDNIVAAKTIIQQTSPREEELKLLDSRYIQLRNLILSSDIVDPRLIFGEKEKITKENVKQYYKEIILLFHPDKVNTTFRIEGTAIFQALTDAYLAIFNVH